MTEYIQRKGKDKKMELKKGLRGFIERIKLTADANIGRAYSEGGTAGGADTPTKAGGFAGTEAAALARNAGIVVLGVLFGGARAFMGSYPFGIGLLCAAGRSAPYIYAGLVLGAIFSGSELLPLLASATVSFGVRIIFARVLQRGESGDDTSEKTPFGAIPYTVPQYFTEAIGFRTAAAVMGAFSGGIIRIVFGGFLYFDMFGTLFQMVAAPAICFLLSGLTERTRRFTVYYEAGICMAAFMLVWALRDLNPFGFSLSLVCGFLFTVYAAHMGGMLRGGMIGLVCGLACGFQTAPVLAVAGLAYGLFIGMGKLTAVSAAAVAGVVMELPLGGVMSLSTAAPDIIAAAVIFAPLVKFDLLPKVELGVKTGTVPTSLAIGAAVSEERRMDSEGRVEAVAGAFSALSQMCMSLSDRAKRPGIYETRMLCTDVFDRSCRHCANNSVCFDKNYETMSEAIDVLARRLRKNGRLEREDLPQAISGICPSPDKLISEANLHYARLMHNIAERDKTEVFAMDYETVSKILAGTTERDSEEYEIDGELSHRVEEAVGYMDFYANSIAVFGRRKLRIVAGGVDLGRVRVSSDELTRICENVCERRLGRPQFHVESDYVTMTMEAQPMIRLSATSASLEKRDETVCGDSAVEFSGKDGHAYLLISDGMGSGHEAALTSRIAGLFLRRMLEAGAGVNCTLELLNNFIRYRSVECFATVDLLEVDTLCSEARFIKSGAAPSYVIRDGSLFKIASGTMPVGITREINAEQIKFRLEVGDTVVMVSDGVAQTLEDSAWLADIIMSEWEDDIEKLSKRILSAAAERGNRKDDMTVGLVRIDAA